VILSSLIVKVDPKSGIIQYRYGKCFKGLKATHVTASFPKMFATSVLILKEAMPLFEKCLNGGTFEPKVKKTKEEFAEEFFKSIVALPDPKKLKNDPSELPKAANNQKSVPILHFLNF
jgi:hypothetical protein